MAAEVGAVPNISQVLVLYVLDGLVDRVAGIDSAVFVYGDEIPREMTVDIQERGLRYLLAVLFVLFLSHRIVSRSDA